MDAFCLENTTRKIAFVVINFDDLLHEYADTYEQQIREGITRNLIPGLEILLSIKPPFYSATP